MKRTDSSLTSLQEVRIAAFPHLGDECADSQPAVAVSCDVIETRRLFPPRILTLTGPRLVGDVPPAAQPETLRLRLPHGHTAQRLSCRGSWVSPVVSKELLVLRYKVCAAKHTDLKGADRRFGRRTPSVPPPLGESTLPAHRRPVAVLFPAPPVPLPGQNLQHSGLRACG